MSLRGWTYAFPRCEPAPKTGARTGPQWPTQGPRGGAGSAAVSWGTTGTRRGCRIRRSGVLRIRSDRQQRTSAGVLDPGCQFERSARAWPSAIQRPLGRLSTRACHWTSMSLLGAHGDVQLHPRLWCVLRPGYMHCGYNLDGFNRIIPVRRDCRAPSEKSSPMFSNTPVIRKFF